MKKKLLIAGDSFAADWSKKYKNTCGWVNTLCEDILAKEILDWEPKINLIDYINKWNTTRNG